MTNSRVSTGHNGDGQRADFSGFPARLNEAADVGPNPFPRIQPPLGGLLSAGHGPDTTTTDRSQLSPGCGHVAPSVASGPSPSPLQIEANLRNARAL